MGAEDVFVFFSRVGGVELEVLDVNVAFHRCRSSCLFVEVCACGDSAPQKDGGGGGRCSEGLVSSETVRKELQGLTVIQNHAR